MEIDNPFNYNMDKIKAAYLPHEMAFPQRFVLDPALAKSSEGQKVKDACPYDAIELNMQAKSFNLNVGSIVWATGWSPYDAKKLDTLGFGQYPNVLTNVMFEASQPRTARGKSSGLGRQGATDVPLCIRRFSRRKPHGFLLGLLHGIDGHHLRARRFRTRFTSSLISVQRIARISMPR
jgi:hypothetical protein